MTDEQVRRIIACGRERHIDVVPCLELYGHLHDLFRVERHADLAAVPHGSEFNPLKPPVLDLLTNWLDQITRLFPSPFVHVGMGPERFRLLSGALPDEARVHVPCDRGGLETLARR